MLVVKQTQVINVLPSAARTSTGNTQVINISNFRSFSSFLTVTARSGTTPTLACQWFISADQSNWYNLSTLSIGTHVTYSAGSQIPSVDLASMDLIAPYLRLTYTIGGTTPSWTFQIDLHAYQS